MTLSAPINCAKNSLDTQVAISAISKITHALKNAKYRKDAKNPVLKYSGMMEPKNTIATASINVHKIVAIVNRNAPYLNSNNTKSIYVTNKRNVCINVYCVRSSVLQKITITIKMLKLYKLDSKRIPKNYSREPYISVQMSTIAMKNVQTKESANFSMILKLKYGKEKIVRSSILT